MHTCTSPARAVVYNVFQVHVVEYFLLTLPWLRPLSRFEVLSGREHRLHPAELDPWLPHSASSGHFQGIQTAPISVGKVQGLAFSDALFSRRGLRVSGLQRG